MGVRSCTRRELLGRIGAGTASAMAAACLSSCRPGGEEKALRPKADEKKPTHIVTLSFDDGFRKSSIRTAEIYEKHKLSACINVIATGHVNTFKPPDEYMVASDRGDFGLWNELKQRGHEIMPHGYRHANKAQMPFAQARDLILRCLEYFSKELKGFEPKDAVFNFPYNASTPELESWLPTQVKAFRTGGGAINPLPHAGQVKLTCVSFGPGNCERDIEEKIAQLLARESGWLIYNTHGLDAEGWGPIRSSFLDELLARLTAIDSVAVMPAATCLAQQYC
jgi:peptidoglycan/xylan/chitin deacetylase (PgdA/CDA1 family)